MSSNSDEPILPIAFPPVPAPLRERAAFAQSYLVRYGYPGCEAHFEFTGTRDQLLDALEVVFRDVDVEAMTIRKLGA